MSASECKERMQKFSVVNRLARDLQGIAHTVVEPVVTVARRLSQPAAATAAP